MSDIVFTDEEELEFNLGTIHQDILGHEYRSNDSDHSVPPITEDAFSMLKNEIANVRRHMSLFQEKVDNQFNGMREFVEESVKLIWNELRFVKHQSSEFIEKEDSVDNIIILVNVSESFHWILVIFRIGHRCLYVYDSMMEGVVHSNNVLDHVRFLSTMIPLFLVATNFYKKRSDIDWYWEAGYIDKSLSEPLEYVILKDTQQQGPQSKNMNNLERSWMYERLDGRRVLYSIFVIGVDEFIQFACSQPNRMSGDKVRCPCAKCENYKFMDVETVKYHLYQSGFIENYFIWKHQGKRDDISETSYDNALHGGGQPIFEENPY
ncbi:hypothetical protein T459_21513 [Capsicum annuum]|uniref:Transposase-associated domain-containing protein n=1 Tax=Capsicum annuum TaxID=4072 RepID=A0A2G2YWW1_CAPAN|nr:hypothetical protein T459_21513 [Capsicum annuum]